MKPGRATVFVGSSNEAIYQAKRVARIIDGVPGLKAALWKDCFPPSGVTLLQIEEIATKAAGAVFLITPDDPLSGGGRNGNSGRENVLMEHGYFLGKLGRTRVALCCYQDVTLPSDLLALTHVRMGQITDEEVIGKEAEKTLRKWARGLLSVPLPMSVQTYLYRSEIKWPEFDDTIRKRFWVCGTSLCGLKHRQVLERLWAKGLRDIRIILPCTRRGTEAWAQLNWYDQCGGLVNGQLDEALKSFTALSSSVRKLSSAKPEKYVRRYPGIMFANITIMDDSAMVAFYDALGIGENNLTMHLYRAQNSQAFDRIEQQVDDMWKASS